MVRTLDFHSNNVGSIPAGLIHMKYDKVFSFVYKTSFGKKPSVREVSPKIELHFASLIPLADAKDLFETPKNVNNALTFKSRNNLNNTRVSLKKSVLLAAWLHHLSSNCKSKSRASVTSLPKKRKLYTLTKAPMAHKTNSKEQYMFKFFFFRCSFQLPFNKTNSAKTVYQSVLSSDLVFREFPWISTNLLIVKSLSYTHSATHSNYLNYNMFIRNFKKNE